MPEHLTRKEKQFEDYWQVKGALAEEEES